MFPTFSVTSCSCTCITAVQQKAVSVRSYAPAFISPRCAVVHYSAFSNSKIQSLAGEWRKLHNKELSDRYSLPNIVRVVKSIKYEMGGACGANGAGERGA